MNVRLTVKGDKEIIRKLNLLDDLNKDAMEETIKRVIELVRTDAEYNIRHGRPEWPPFKYKEGLGRFGGFEGLYRTGELAESMKTTYLSQGNQTLGIVYSDVEHSVFHELGTTGFRAVPPRPFLWPAFIDNQDRIVEIAKEETEKVARGASR